MGEEGWDEGELCKAHEYEERCLIPALCSLIQQSRPFISSCWCHSCWRRKRRGRKGNLNEAALT